MIIQIQMSKKKFCIGKIKLALDASVKSVRWLAGYRGFILGQVTLKTSKIVFAASLLSAEHKREVGSAKCTLSVLKLKYENDQHIESLKAPMFHPFIW